MSTLVILSLCHSLFFLYLLLKFCVYNNSYHSLEPPAGCGLHMWQLCEEVMMPILPGETEAQTVGPRLHDWQGWDSAWDSLIQAWDPFGAAISQCLCSLVFHPWFLCFVLLAQINASLVAQMGKWDFGGPPPSHFRWGCLRLWTVSGLSSGIVWCLMTLTPVIIHSEYLSSQPNYNWNSRRTKMLWYLGLKSITGATAWGNFIFFLSPLRLLSSLGVGTDLSLFLKTSWTLFFLLLPPALNSFSSVPYQSRGFDLHLVSIHLKRIVIPMAEFLPRISWEVCVFPDGPKQSAKKSGRWEEVWQFSCEN